MTSKFKKGDIAYLKCVGFGLTSYEETIVERVSKNKVYVGGNDYPYDMDSGIKISDGPNLGLNVYLCVKNEDVKNAKNYIKESND